MKKKILVLGSNGMAGHIIAIGLKKESKLYNVNSINIHLIVQVEFEWFRFAR